MKKQNIFNNTPYTVLKRIWEKAQLENKQPENSGFILSKGIIRNDWDRLYPMLAQIRALPAREIDIKTAKKFYPLYRRIPWLCAERVMVEQNKYMMMSSDLLVLARALRKDHSEIDVMKLNPRDVLLAFLPKNARNDYDWSDFRELTEKWGYDENGIKDQYHPAAKLPEPDFH